VSVTFAGHSTVLLDVDGVRLLTDPLLRRRIGVLIRRTAVPAAELRHDLDAVLISHAHLDHLDVPSLRMIDRGTPIIAPRGVGALLRRQGFEPTEVEVGDVVELPLPDAPGAAPSGAAPGAGLSPGPGRGPVRVRAVPAFHSGTRYPLGTPSEALGYVVEGGLSAYFAGDTGLFDGMQDLGPLDVAVLPVGGWGPRLPDDHLGPLTAARALQLLKPRACVPVHWGTLYPPWLPPEFNAKWSEWPRAFERYARHLAPGVEVRVLPPGETTTFTPDSPTAPPTPPTAPPAEAPTAPPADTPPVPRAAPREAS
jgi:L-ascorbate metabolism protein UlaG (beta-lactamase superfamily)